MSEALALLGYKNYKAALAKIRELSQIKVLDAAMGSGSFLLRAFDTFVDAYNTYNTECARRKHAHGQTTGMLFDAGRAGFPSRSSTSRNSSSPKTFSASIWTNRPSRSPSSISGCA